MKMSVLVAGGLLSIGAAPLATIADSSTRSRLERSVTAYVKPLQDLEVFSGVVLIARDRDVLLSKPYGIANRELGIKTAVDQRFRIASISKAFTAMAIGRLAESGTLQLDSPLDRFIPDFPLGRQITVKHLLTHTAGIANVNSLPYDEESFEETGLPDIVHALKTRGVAFPPGSRFQYSNGGYALLAQIIETAAAKPYEEVVRSQILEPLGLRNTGHEPDGGVVAHRAYGYAPDPRRPNAVVVAPFQQMNTKTGGGSMYSSAPDLHRWLLALMGDNVLKRSTYEQLFLPVDGALLFCGRSPGYNACMSRHLHDGIIVVVLSNNYASGMLEQMTRDPAPWLAAWRSSRPGGEISIECHIRVSSSTSASIGIRQACRFRMQ